MTPLALTDLIPTGSGSDFTIAEALDLDAPWLLAEVQADRIELDADALAALYDAVGGPDESACTVAPLGANELEAALHLSGEALKAVGALITRVGTDASLLRQADALHDGLTDLQAEVAMSLNRITDSVP
ncbi:MAG: hypothetical protein AAGI52_06520 [Bacteroidota bacterium]